MAARNLTPAAPKISTMSTSPPALWVSASLRQPLRRLCRITLPPKRGAQIARSGAWWRLSAMLNWMKATSMNACRKAGSMICAIHGGSSTITAKAWTGWCMKGFGKKSKRSSRPLAGAHSCCDTGRYNAKLSGNRAAKHLSAGFKTAPTSYIQR